MEIKYRSLFKHTIMQIDDRENVYNKLFLKGLTQ